jgi:hypothetical protein
MPRCTWSSTSPLHLVGTRSVTVNPPLIVTGLLTLFDTYPTVERARGV